MQKIIALMFMSMLFLTACTLSPSEGMDEKGEEMAEDVAAEKSMMDDEMMKDDEMMEKDSMDEEVADQDQPAEIKEDKMMDDAEKAEAEEVGVVSPSGAKYIAYSSEAVKELEGKRYALFFHAQWCPSCQKLESAIKYNLPAWSEGATVLKVDYDTEEDLKKQYGIVGQNTVVFINADGSVSRLATGATAQQILEFLEG